MIKRTLALLLALLLVISLAACGSSSSETTTTSETAETSTGTEETTNTAETESTSDEEGTDTAASGTTEITYPVEGNYSFSMISVMRANVADALGDGDYSESISYAALADATGIEIEFEMLAEATYLETMNIRIASQDLPDLFSQTIGSYDSKNQAAIEDGVVVDLTEYLEYAPDWAALLESDQSYYEGIVNSDGSISKVANRTAGVVTQMGLIRGDWLDELGLDTPTTLDELTDVLQAFKENYNTTNTLLLNSDLNSPAEFAFNFTAMGFKALSFQLTEPDSDEVICGLATDAYVEYLEYLNSLYEEGLITSDFISISKENDNFESAFYNGEAGVWTDDCKFTDTAYATFSNDEDWTAEAFAFSGEDYHMVSTSSVGLTTAYISTVCEYPEIAVQFLNYGFTEEGMKLVAYGIEDETYTIDDAGTVAYTDLILNNPDGLSYDQSIVYYLVSNWMPYNVDTDTYLSITYTGSAVAAINLWTSEGGDSSMTLPTAVSLTGEEQEQVTDLANDVLTHLGSMAPAVILGQITSDEYREAVEEAYAMGLEEITEIYQAAYDRYLNS